MPLSVFGVDRTATGAPTFEVFPISADGTMRTTAGIRLDAPHALEVVLDVDVVVVPTWRDPTEQPPERVLEVLRAAHERGVVVVGLCLGAFVLAAAGLLDGRRAATHWRYASEFAAAYPTVEVDASVLFVDHGDVLTSAGTAAGIDACLHLEASSRVITVVAFAHSTSCGARSGQRSKPCHMPAARSIHSVSGHGGSTSCAFGRSAATCSEVSRGWLGSDAPLRNTSAGMSSARASSSGSPGTSSPPQLQYASIHRSMVAMNSCGSCASSSSRFGGWRVNVSSKLGIDITASRPSFHTAGTAGAQ